MCNYCCVKNSAFNLSNTSTTVHTATSMNFTVINNANNGHVFKQGILKGRRINQWRTLDISIDQ